VVPQLVKGLQEAGPHDRIVFYMAERRTDIHREVTSGALFVQGPLLTIVLANYRNGVDAVAGVPAYDRLRPDFAVAPQRFKMAFEPEEFVPPPAPQVIESTSPKVAVNYREFLSRVGFKEPSSLAPSL
jgi:hypothetical protein